MTDRPNRPNRHIAPNPPDPDRPLFPQSCVMCDLTSELQPDHPSYDEARYTALHEEFRKAMWAVRDAEDRQQHVVEVGMALLATWHAIHHPRLFFKQIIDGVYGSMGYRQMVDDGEEGEEE